eukprot:jgi/Ulvmu1/86/UM001_0089.1
MKSMGGIHAERQFLIGRLNLINHLVTSPEPRNKPIDQCCLQVAVAAASKPRQRHVPQHIQASASGSLLRRFAIPNSAMNPQYDYALPTRVARLMAASRTQAAIAGTDGTASCTLTGAACTRGPQYASSSGSCRAVPLQVRAAAFLHGTPPATAYPQLHLSSRSAAVSGSAGDEVRSRSAPLPAADDMCQWRQVPLQTWMGTENAGDTIVLAPYAIPDISAIAPAATQDDTISGRPMDDTLPVPSDSFNLPPPSLQAPDAQPDEPHPRSEVCKACPQRNFEAHACADTVSLRQSFMPPVSGPLMVESLVDEGSTVVPIPGEQLIKRLQCQLDAFREDDLFLGRFEMLGRQRQRGGQAIVQFAIGAQNCCEYAIKFFLDYESFLTEAALYAACFPHVRAAVSDAVAVRVDTGLGSSGDVALPMANIVARFLPQVEAVCDGAAGGLEDPHGEPLPPCIVMEKGESLHDWRDRAEPDLFTCLAVLSNISMRLADMHNAGYVHRDLKPANVMWLPHANRWTVIDFGCVARVGELAPLSYTLAYTPPEVLAACEAGHLRIKASPDLDTWSFGVMAFELLTGAPAFNFLSDGHGRVIQRLRGDLPLPWEGQLSKDVKQQLGVLRGPVLKLLRREPAKRISMRDFHVACSKLFADRSTVEA